MCTPAVIAANALLSCDNSYNGFIVFGQVFFVPYIFDFFRKIMANIKLANRLGNNSE